MSTTSCRFYENKYPDVDELVMVNVKQIQEMGAYVQLLEYNNIEGMILLSELSRRRIRSVQKLIRVGRNEVVVVLRVDKEKGYIDLSKRRVSPEDIIKCEDKFNKSKTVHSILRNVTEKHSIPLEELYMSIGWPLYRKYGHAYDAFKFAIVDSESVFEGLTPSNPQIIEDLIVQITRRLTLQAVKIRADVEVSCFEYEGIDAVKRALKAAEAKNSKDALIKVKLIAPPLYVVITSALDKKLGIQILEEALEEIEKSITASGGEFVVKMKPKDVNEVDELELQALMQRMERENAEKSGDEDESESDED
ncbi:eukaryotic translation initiation factor 2 subunit alpha [Pneumocystis carinii B80]|uniref:Eukaryotic translation initiation factor 2 subunit alpha n=1 Tax=Pneumocystis carinii (strain B80) TaxID=1408658 RepID=A0A0W4ZT37_PNEC8|nr:eukaryotic translation initiation factor 2 subunit alpha [Pneumocystis carinii B80]KTW31524.1 eukaryotic translation initiation factor 2 subunit alpha [Pneumocystis carinii B80]